MATIAVTCGHSYQKEASQIGSAYIEAVEQAGGLAVVIPPSLSPTAGAKVLNQVDGLLLTGGNDLSPFLYGQQPHPQLGDLDPFRDELEPVLVKEAVGRGIPVLGICRGMQVTNASLGGTIVQHIDQSSAKAIQHRQNPPGWRRHHHVDVKGGTRLASILGEGVIGVNSHHHQAVDKLAPSLKISALAPDGVIEAFESDSPWILGVQWHPEIMIKRYPEFLKIFISFIAACSGGK